MCIASVFTSVQFQILRFVAIAACTATSLVVSSHGPKQCSAVLWCAVLCCAMRPSEQLSILLCSILCLCHRPRIRKMSFVVSGSDWIEFYVLQSNPLLPVFPVSHCLTQYITIPALSSAILYDRMLSAVLIANAIVAVALIQCSAVLWHFFEMRQ